MAYEITTPLLLESVDAVRAVIDGRRYGGMEAAEARDILGGARVLQAAVREDVRARLAATRIAAQEAKLIEDSRRGDSSAVAAPSDRGALASPDQGITATGEGKPGSAPADSRERSKTVA